MSNIEIVVTANGFIVSPAFDPNKTAYTTNFKEHTYVFESFESLSDWLKENLK